MSWQRGVKDRHGFYEFSLQQAVHFLLWIQVEISRISHEPHIKDQRIACS